MTKQVSAIGISELKISQVDEETVALVLIDSKEKPHGFLVNPETLNVLLEELLGLAAQWADKVGLEIQKLTGSQRALPAHHIGIEKGRNAKECAVRIFVGKVELTFLIPLDSVISATSQLVKQIDLTSGSPPH